MKGKIAMRSPDSASAPASESEGEEENEGEDGGIEDEKEKEEKEESEEDIEGEIGKVVDVPGDGGDSTSSAVVVAEGSNPVDPATGRVLTLEGKPVDETATSGSSYAPRQSVWVNEADLPPELPRVKIYPDRIRPEQMTARAGQPISLAVTAAGEAVEILRFDSPKLRGVVVAVGSGKTRVISFHAPEEPGEYTYYSDMSDHRDQGAEGVLTVE
jgi:hypothetical protein